MPFTFVRGNIGGMSADALVCASYPSLTGNGGASGREENIRVTGGSGRAKIVIRAVAPVWEGGGRGEAEALASCYRNCLKTAAESGCASVVLPLISAGARGFPRMKALRIAEGEIAAARHGRSDPRAPETNGRS